MRPLDALFKSERVERNISTVQEELIRLKQKHPEVNFFWLELAIADSKTESTELTEQLDEMEAGC